MSRVAANRIVAGVHHNLILIQASFDKAVSNTMSTIFLVVETYLTVTTTLQNRTQPRPASVRHGGIDK